MLEEIKGFTDNGSMVRVDVFSKYGKYYCVPDYTADIYAGRLPDRAATAGKKLPEWDVMDDTYKFEFALYPNDLIWIKSKKDICMSKQRDNNNSRMSNKSEVGKYGVYFYYRGLDIATAAAAIITHNNCYLARGVGLKTIGEIKKGVFDVLGNISFVQEEKRPPAKIKQK